jgi:hypothetical protein
MKLKGIIPVLFISMLACLITPAFAADGTPKTISDKTTNEAHSQQIMNRLIEIRDMDKSNLTSSEKKALRKEVKEIKKEARADKGHGVYLSVGAIIIIVLLLILLL